MDTPNYKECYALFTKEINEFKSAVTHYSEEFAAQGMKICLKHINAIRASVSKHTFSNPDEEISFFKEIKPDMVGHFIFYYHLHKIQSEKNITHSLKSYYSDKIQEYKDYFKKYDICYHTYENNISKYDEPNFLRCNLNLSDYNYHIYSLIDNGFSTSKDYLHARFKGYNMIIDLLQMELDRMEGRKNQSNIHKRKKSKWTGSTIEATELVYALFETKCINNGETDIKELVEILGTVIDLPDFDIYRSFIDIKNRKKNSTVFLDKMKQRLLDRINEE